MQSKKVKLLSDRDLVTIDSMTKYTILNTFAIVVSQIQFVCLKFLIVMQLLYLTGVLTADNLEDLNPQRLRNYMAVSIFPCDQIVNCMVLLLNFRFNEVMYWKCCSFVHNCVKRRYINEVEVGLQAFMENVDEDGNDNKNRKVTELDEFDPMETTEYWMSTTENQHIVLHENVTSYPINVNGVHRQSTLFSGGPRKDTINFTATVPADADSTALFSMEQ